MPNRVHNFTDRAGQTYIFLLKMAAEAAGQASTLPQKIVAAGSGHIYTLCRGFKIPKISKIPKLKFSSAFRRRAAGIIFAAAAVLPAIAAADSAAAAPPPAEVSLELLPMTLNQAVETALERNRTLKASRLDYLAANKRVSEARAMFGFNLKLEGNFQKVDDPTAFKMAVYPPLGFATVTSFIPGQPQSQQIVASGIPSIMELQLNEKWQHAAEMKLTKPLLTFGKRSAAIGAAGLDRDAKLLAVEQERQELVLRVKEAFFGMLLARKAAETFDESLERAEGHLKAAETKFKVGTSPKLDVIRATGELEQAKEDLIGARKGTELARMNLNNVIGLPVESPTDITDRGAYGKIALEELEHYMESALAGRPEIGQLAKGIEAVRLSSKLDKMKPTVALAGQWNFHNRGSGFASEHAWRAILALDAPIFDAGLAHAKVARARRAEEKLELNMTDLKEGIALQVTQAYLDVVEAGQRVDTSEAILKTAEEGYRMAELGFKEGVTSQIDLLDTEHGLTRARLNRAKADYDYELAKARLARAAGEN